MVDPSEHEVTRHYFLQAEKYAAEVGLATGDPLYAREPRPETT
jgi:hypothetical protein